MSDANNRELSMVVQHIGSIQIPYGKVDIADPSIDRGEYATLNIKPGEYYCKAYVEKNSEDFPIWICQIVNANDFGKGKTGVREMCKHECWEKIADVNVYSGLAGFFAFKPNFTQDIWMGICYSLTLGNEKAFIRSFIHDQKAHDSFFTYSGLGDGTYPVYAIYKRNKIVALEIRFYTGGIAK